MFPHRARPPLPFQHQFNKSEIFVCEREREREGEGGREGGTDGRTDGRTEELGEIQGAGQIGPLVRCWLMTD